uniref:Reverse transcriptase domain-containing protein n=1 Tax=Triticum urartu TaxID=4572 RepID=A0A8R7QUJ5_TRIUA
MLRKLGFKQCWVDLIMKCVSSVKYPIKVNGALSQQFSPSCGLRQGDPISPYLFVIYAEGLSALLHDAQRRGLISGVKICSNAPAVSHLLYADDSMLLLKASSEEVAALRGVLDLYEQCSGQCINTEKSATMFSPNTLAEIREVVKQTIHIQSENWNEKYLGLPVHVG